MTSRSRLTLVVFATYDRPTRPALTQHLFALRKYGHDPTFYLNAAVPWAGLVARFLRPTCVVFHTSYLGQRWRPHVMHRLIRRMQPLRALATPKLMLPQDEFIGSDQLVECIRTFRVDHVFSVAPESEWRTIYGDVLDAGNVQFSRVLTGYVDDEMVAKRNPADDGDERPIDIGYRAWHAEAWLGRHGRMKVEIANRVLESPAAEGMRLDISTRDEDTILGSAWYQFLTRCRWTLGVEGGASILDRDGSLSALVRAFVRSRPNATFAEIEAACFPGMDGMLRLSALSPRHLEACLTKTAQILVRGEYNGILTAGVHYLAVEPDFSNLSQVLERSRSDELRRELAERAYRDVIESGLYSYSAFVRLVELAVQGTPGAPHDLAASRHNPIAAGLFAALENAGWMWLRVRRFCVRAYRSTVATIRSWITGPRQGS